MLASELPFLIEQLILQYGAGSLLAQLPWANLTWRPRRSETLKRVSFSAGKGYHRHRR